MYEAGVMVAFLLWVYTVVMLVVNGNSRLARNLAKVNLRLSWASGEPVPAADRSTAGWRLFKVVFLLAAGIIGAALSWASVAWWVGAQVYQRSKHTGMPQAVKELRWKLKNVDMTAEQITIAMQEATAAIIPATRDGWRSASRPSRF